MRSLTPLSDVQSTMDTCRQENTDLAFQGSPYSLIGFDGSFRRSDLLDVRHRCGPHKCDGLWTRAALRPHGRRGGGAMTPSGMRTRSGGQSFILTTFTLWDTHYFVIEKADLRRRADEIYSKILLL